MPTCPQCRHPGPKQLLAYAQDAGACKRQLAVLHYIRTSYGPCVSNQANRQQACMPCRPFCIPCPAPPFPRLPQLPHACICTVELAAHTTLCTLLPAEVSQVLSDLPVRRRPGPGRRQQGRTSAGHIPSDRILRRPPSTSKRDLEAQHTHTGTHPHPHLGIQRPPGLQIQTRYRRQPRGGSDEKYWRVAPSHIGETDTRPDCELAVCATSRSALPCPAGTRYFATGKTFGFLLSHAHHLPYLPQTLHVRLSGIKTDT